MPVQSVFHQRAATFQISPKKELFDSLTQHEKFYAHHLARAAWHGSRIVLRQTSPEAIGIFDFILELDKACEGEWDRLVDQDGVTPEDLDEILEFAGMFLSRQGNYWCDDEKVIPSISADALRKMASISPNAATALEKVIDPLLKTSPLLLGFDGPNTQSSYYPGEEPVAEKEIGMVAKVMAKHFISPENTRITKRMDGDRSIFTILQASAETGEPIVLDDEPSAKILLERGDYAAELSKICSELTEAIKYASNETQAASLADHIECLRTGNWNAYKESQKKWVTDVYPRVETISGFAEPYRDPYGVRCEWQGVVGILDQKETEKMQALVDKADKIIRSLPWAADGKGPFEITTFQAPNYAIVHELAFCGSEICLGQSLPNCNDIREDYGVKNFYYTNRNKASEYLRRSNFLYPSEAEHYNCYINAILKMQISIHELLGHSTTRLLAEIAPGVFNFDRENPPINPFTGQAIETWYKTREQVPGFEKLGLTVEELRAYLVGFYLTDNRDILSIFGFEEENTVSADEITYLMYLNIGVMGLGSLISFDCTAQVWNNAADNCFFAILNYLLLNGGGVIAIDHDPINETLHVRVDRTKIISHGKPALGEFLYRIHIWRSIADFKSCQELLETLNPVGEQVEAWMYIVRSVRRLKLNTVQANTFVKENGDVEIKHYETNNRGIIQSWAERGV